MTETRWRHTITGDHMREIQSLTFLLALVPWIAQGGTHAGLSPGPRAPLYTIVITLKHDGDTYALDLICKECGGAVSRMHAQAFSAPLLPCRHIARDQREDKEHPLRRGISMKRLPRPLSTWVFAPASTWAFAPASTWAFAPASTCNQREERTC